MTISIHLRTNLCLGLSTVLLLSSCQQITTQSNAFKNIQHAEAVVSINRHVDSIQKSNYGKNSFKIHNKGDVNISSVVIDASDAIFHDSIFDPFGVAGDTVSKPISVDTEGSTGILPADDTSYIGKGGTAGFKTIIVKFSDDIDGGFEPGESIGFSVDMDPNSIAGAPKKTLDAGSYPQWDVGGISGAELQRSKITVSFSNGVVISGQLHSAANNAGSHALISSQSLKKAPTLEVETDSEGTYNSKAPQVFITGPANETARVVLSKGFIQPARNLFDDEYKQILQSQLESVKLSKFPANNAVEFQIHDVPLTGEKQNISELFDVYNVEDYDFEGEDKLPLAFSSAIIDTKNDGLPISAVTQPIYLTFKE